MQIASNTTKKTGFMTNPAISRVINKGTYAIDDRTSCTYMGVFRKTIFFLILTLVGVLGFYAVNWYADASGAPLIVSVVSNNNVLEFHLTLIEIVGISIAALVTLIMALVNIFVCLLAGSAICVTGSIYVLAEGYLLAFISSSLVASYRWMAMLALTLTIALVLSLLILYKKQVIRVTSKFRKVTTALFLTVIIGSVFIGLMYLLSRFSPAASSLSTSISGVTSNPIVSIVISVVFILIACLFLISDFDSVRIAVTDHLEKKYEWALAFGIAYTVLYLYLKILEIFIKAAGNSKRN